MVDFTLVMVDTVFLIFVDKVLNMVISADCDQLVNAQCDERSKQRHEGIQPYEFECIYSAVVHFVPEVLSERVGWVQASSGSPAGPS